MTPTDYIEKASRTDLDDYKGMAERCQDEFTLRVLHAAMGLVTEAGEIMDALKKHLIYGKPIDIVNLMEEHGDSDWYKALLAKACGYSFEEAMERNIEKLRKRFPEKFSSERALNRDLNAERNVLEGRG